MKEYWYAQEVEKQLQTGTVAESVQVSMGIAVMKEVGAKWLTALLLHAETSIVMNGFKNVAIVDVVKKVREAPPPDDNSSNLPPPEVYEDPFNSCSEAEDS